MKRILILFGLLFLLLFIGTSTNQFKIKLPDIESIFKSTQKQVQIPGSKLRIESEESVITKVAEDVSPSVVTVSVVRSRQIGRIFEVDPFNPFDVFRQRQNQNLPRIQDIGSAFIVSEDGLIVTNKHVVSDTDIKYKVITKEDKEYDVQKIYRDPSNDLAIIKINGSKLTPVKLGDSDNLKVGQMAIAIGTALGEFRNTVTVGVISGLGRGITAGSPFEGFSERLDNVIQTDAAINPGNSGGPLLNSSGAVIGVSVAISQEGQNIGFALPINLVKNLLDEFKRSGGRFERPFLGVKYRMITKDLALTYDVPEGAYVQELVADSPAEKAGIEKDDIITKIDGAKVVEDNGGLSKEISGKKIGDKISLEIWRDGDTKSVSVIVGQTSGE